MKDFTEQEAFLTSRLELSRNTPTVSDNPLDTKDQVNSIEDTFEIDSLSDPEITAATIAALKPYTQENNIASA